jgi:hypothetical protein
MNVSNSVFYRNLCDFQPFVPSFCGGQAQSQLFENFRDCYCYTSFRRFLQWRAH